MFRRPPPPLQQYFFLAELHAYACGLVNKDKIVLKFCNLIQIFYDDIYMEILTTNEICQIFVCVLSRIYTCTLRLVYLFWYQSTNRYIFTFATYIAWLTNFFLLASVSALYGTWEEFCIQFSFRIGCSGLSSYRYFYSHLLSLKSSHFSNSLFVTLLLLN